MLRQALAVAASIACVVVSAAPVVQAAPSGKAGHGLRQSAETSARRAASGATSAEGEAAGSPTSETPPVEGATTTQSTETATTTTAAAPSSSEASSSGFHPSGIAIAAIVLAALLVLASLGWLLARAFAYEPPSLLSLHHSFSEAGFRASSTWAELLDWLRLGR